MLQVRAISPCIGGGDGVPYVDVAARVEEEVAPMVSRLLRSEGEVLRRLTESVEGPGWTAFAEAVRLLDAVEGRVITSGMGKSGHIARKVAATMASLGTPASFVHPGEASHGDLGMLTAKDGLLAFSNSGNSAELGDILEHARSVGVPVVGVTMGPESMLARMSDVVVLLPRMPEGCPLGLAPTTSTTAQLAVGDALSVALCVLREFTHDGFRRLHPGGSLGQATTRVGDAMLTNGRMPLVGVGADTAAALYEMAHKGFNMAGVTDERGRLVGVVSAGDLTPGRSGPVAAVLSGPAVALSPDDTVAAAVKAMDERGLRAAFVVRDGRPVGVLRRPESA